MKKFKIGDLEVSMCENIDDMGINRYTAFEGYMNESESGVHRPSMLQLYQDWLKEFDKQSLSGMLIRLHEEIISIKRNDTMENADQMMFALMTLEEGEKMESTDKNLLKEKMNKYASLGLTQGTVIKEVENFIRVLANS